MDAETTVQKIDEHARAMAENTSDVAEVAGYAVLAPRDEETPPYAIPIAPADDPDEAAAQLAELTRHFAGRAAQLRIELSPLGWRALVPRLALAGLAAEEETPLFVCDPVGLRPVPGAAEVRWVDAGADLAFPLAVMRQGFELRGEPPTREEVAGLAAALAGPLRLALAIVGGAPAGTGASAPLGGVTEISAVSTLPAMRRQGVAAQIVAFLTGAHFAGGGELAWACTADPAMAGVLYRTGFRDAGLRSRFVLP